MKRGGRLTKPAEFATVYHEGSTQTDRWLVLKAKPNQLKFSRYGISVSKRLGTAVVRNRVKRVLREIIRIAPLVPGWDFILIARNPAADGNYHKLKESVNHLLSRAHIIAN